MLRNSKILVNYLNDNQVEKLKELGFHQDCLGRNEPIKNSSESIEKYYSCCGGTFRLLVYLYKDYVQIRTPYNSWWCDDWSLSEFTSTMEKFQEELKRDLKELRKVGIIS